MISENSNDFIYSDDNYINEISSNDSPFDTLLKSKWNDVLRNHVFRYNVTEDSLKTKIMEPKRYHLIGQLNEGRGVLRRKPQTMDTITMPFDGEKFNFTKINPKEILFNIKSRDGSCVATIIVNTAPIEYGNSLMVPFLDKCRPQIFTGDSLRMAIAIVALNGDGYLRAGFNSLGAMASVNHQHWHLYYYKHKMMIESLPIVNNILKEWPIEGIVFEIRELKQKVIDTVVNRVSRIIDFCIGDAQIGHNLFVTRTRDNTIRVFLWTRESIFGTKNDMVINPAFCEFTGFFMCKTKELFDTIDEDLCIKLLKSVDTRIEEVMHLLNN